MLGGLKSFEETQTPESIPLGSLYSQFLPIALHLYSEHGRPSFPHKEQSPFVGGRKGLVIKENV